jgi:hypothetical protein
MLVPGVERDREQGAGLPLEGDAGTGIVPHRGGAAAVEHKDHLLEQLALRRELAGRRDLADIAVVRGPRRLVIDEDAMAAAPRPWLELDGMQARHVMRADDVEPFAAHPTGVGGILLGGEFLRQFLGNDGGLGHAGSRSITAAVPIQTVVLSGSNSAIPGRGQSPRTGIQADAPGFRSAAVDT